MRDFKGIIFDLDGTLLNTLEDIADSVNEILNSYNFPLPSLTEYKNFIGEGIEQLVYMALPIDHREKAFIDKAVILVREEYRKRLFNKTTLYDGISQMLDILTEKHIKMAILSNKPHDMTLKSHAKFLSTWNFVSVFGDMEEFEKKPEPDLANKIASNMSLPPDEIIFIGDTKTDMITAKNAKMFAVGVLWGFRTALELQENGADILIKKPLDLINFLESPL